MNTFLMLLVVLVRVCCRGMIDMFVCLISVSIVGITEWVLGCGIGTDGVDVGGVSPCVDG